MNYQDRLERNYDSEVISIIATVLKNTSIRVVDLQSLARVAGAISENPRLIQSPALLLNHIRKMQAELTVYAGSNEDQKTFSLITDYLIRRIRDAISPSISNSGFEEFFEQAGEELQEDFDNNDPFAKYLLVEYAQNQEMLPDTEDDVPLAFLKAEIVSRIENKINSNFKVEDGKRIFVFKGSGKALSDLLRVIEGYETIADKNNCEATAWLEQIIETLQKFTSFPRPGYTQRDMEDAEIILREYILALRVRQEEEEERFSHNKIKPLPSAEAQSTIITKRLAEPTISRYIQNILSNDLEGIFAISFIVNASIAEINAIVHGILLMNTQKLKGSVARDDIKYFSNVIKEIVSRLNDKIEQISLNDGNAREYRTLMHSILDQINTTVIEFRGKHQTLNLFPTDLLELASRITEASARWVEIQREA